MYKKKCKLNWLTGKKNIIKNKSIRPCNKECTNSYNKQYQTSTCQHVKFI